MKILSVETLTLQNRNTEESLTIAKISCLNIKSIPRIEVREGEYLWKVLQEIKKAKERMQ